MATPNIVASIHSVNAKDNASFGILQLVKKTSDIWESPISHGPICFCGNRWLYKMRKIIGKLLVTGIAVFPLCYAWADFWVGNVQYATPSYNSDTHICTTYVTDCSTSATSLDIPAWVNHLFVYKDPVTKQEITNNVQQVTAVVLGGQYNTKTYALEKLTVTNSISSVSINGFHALKDIVLANRLASLNINYCSAIQGVTIPDSVSSINFLGCSSLQDVTIPDSVTVIGENCFKDCTSLRRVTIGRNVSTIYYSAFKNCSSLDALNVFDISAWCGIDFKYSSDCMHPLEMAKNLYINYEPITNLVIPSDVAKINDEAFLGCTNLFYLTISDGVEHVGVCAFWGCCCLENVSFGNSVTNIDDCAFQMSGLKNVIIPKKVSHLGGAAFQACVSLTNVVFATDCLSRIEDRAFSDCENLTGTLQLPQNLESIGVDAFFYCDLKSVIIPNSVTSIEWSSFGLITDEAFDTTTIPGIRLLDGWVVGYDYGFSGYANLASVRGIFNYAFSYCQKLTGITLPNAITCIAKGSFLGTGLTNVTIPNSVTSIEDSAFGNCSELKSATIGKNVANIGDNAFSFCSGLTNVIFQGNAPNVGNYVFGDINSECIAYVKKNSTGWGVTIPGVWNGIKIAYQTALMPDIEEDAVPEIVIGFIEEVGFADVNAIKEAIGGSAEEYRRFKDWVQTTIQDEDSVVASHYVAISYLLGADKLVPEGLTSADVKIETFESAAEDNKFSFEISIADVGIGKGVVIADYNREAIKENLKKVLGLEGATKVEAGGDAFSSDGIEIVFDVPVDGKARFTAAPPKEAGNVYFMRVRLKE